MRVPCLTLQCPSLGGQSQTVWISLVYIRYTHWHLFILHRHCTILNKEDWETFLVWKAKKMQYITSNYVQIYWFNALSHIYGSGQLLTRPDSFVLDTALTTYSLHYTTIIEQRSRLLTNISDSCFSLYLNCLTLWILPTFSKWS